MSDIDRIKQEIEELKRELAKLEPGSLLWKMVSDHFAQSFSPVLP